MHMALIVSQGLDALGERRGRLYFAALAYVVDHLYPELLAEDGFRYGVALRMAVAAVCEDVRAHRRERAADAPICFAMDVVGQDHFVDARNGLKYLLALVLGHEDEPLLVDEPGVVVENDDKLIAECAAFSDIPHMPYMYGIEASRNSNDYH